MAKDKYIVLRGVLNYAKVLGDPRPHTGKPQYDKGPYWSVDVTPDAASRKLCDEFGVSDKFREPGDNDKARVGNDTYLSLKVLENRSDGKKNSPPQVVDVTGKPWGNDLIGNGSVADVKVKIVDYGKGIQKGVYLQAIRVLEHVPYETEAFAPLSADDEYFSQSENEPEDLWEDDDVPA